MARRSAIPLEDEIFYPESDGEPMAETKLHLQEMTYLLEALEECFRNEPDAFIGGNLQLYYELGVRNAVVAPDTFVVKGLEDTASSALYLRKEEEAQAAARSRATCRRRGPGAAPGRAAGKRRG